MKTAVLVSGQMRSASLCAEKLRSIYPEASWIIHANADEQATDAFLFRPSVCVIEKQPEVPERKQYAWQIGRYCHGIQTNLRQLWALRRVWEVFEASKIEADCIVRMRPDLDFSILPESPQADAIYIPKFANYWGYNDRFAYGGRELMKTYFKRLDLLDSYIDSGGMFHPETFLGWCLKGFPVKRTNAVFDSVRTDGSRDKPAYGKEWGDIL
jgi:hypothetical protein